MPNYKRLKDIPKDLVQKLSACKYIMPTLGTDPEFFIADKKTGKILAADKFLPDKHNPMLLDGQSNKLFFDGIQAEMNVMKSTCRESVAYYIRECLKKANSVIGADHTIVIKPSVRVQKSVINSAKPEARIFGCDPDFNAYTRGRNTSEIDATTHPYRYAGGHIHVGVSSNYLRPEDREYKLAKTEEGHIESIKFFDYVSGPLLLLMDKSPESKRRRSLYGTAGCFRPTPYGIEYRTPSCWWLKSPAGMSLAFGLVRVAWNLLIANLSTEFKTAVGYTEDEVRAIVNESDIPEAKKFWKAIRPYLSLVGQGTANPLNIKSACNTAGGFIEEDMSCFNSIINDKPVKFKGTTHDNGSVVHALAVFEYLVHHGSDLLISDVLENEWSLTKDKETFYKQNGWVRQLYHKLVRPNEAPAEVQNDFQAFQKSFLASTL